MAEEIDRMMLLRRLTIIFAVIFCVIVVGVACVLIYMNTGDYNGASSDFANIEAYGQQKTASYEVESFDKMLFFSEAVNDERTLFTDEIPSVKIVNSDKYRIDVTADSTLLDKLTVKVEDGALIITFEAENYNDISRGDREYKGLYVDCELFEVTVYAPVSQFYTSAEINLDFDTPKTELLGVVVGGEIREGKIYNIDAESFLCNLSGESNVELSGKVGSAAQLEVWHNSKIDARKLTVSAVSAKASSQLFGFSYIDGSTFSDYSFTDMGFLITLAIILSLLGTIGLCVLFLVKFLRQKKAIDLYIEKVEKEGNFLIKPEKTDEKLLQIND